MDQVHGLFGLMEATGWNWLNYSLLVLGATVFLALLWRYAKKYAYKRKMVAYTCDVCRVVPEKVVDDLERLSRSQYSKYVVRTRELLWTGNNIDVCGGCYRRDVTFQGAKYVVSIRKAQPSHEDTRFLRPVKPFAPGDARDAIVYWEDYTRQQAEQRAAAAAQARPRQPRVAGPARPAAAAAVPEENPANTEPTTPQGEAVAATMAKLEVPECADQEDSGGTTRDGSAGAGAGTPSPGQESSSAPV